MVFEGEIKKYSAGRLKRTTETVIIGWNPRKFYDYEKGETGINLIALKWEFYNVKDKKIILEEDHELTSSEDNYFLTQFFENKIRL